MPLYFTAFSSSVQRFGDSLMRYPLCGALHRKRGQRTYPQRPVHKAVFTEL